jgi:molybdenum cofactor biosynthesis protein B
MSTADHKAQAPKSLNIAVISVSSTRSLAEDESGHWIRKQTERKGHIVVFHEVVIDDAGRIEEMVKRILEVYTPHVILMTGGTGIAAKDVTIEAVKPMLTKELTAFGTLFSFLSYEEIGSPALLSRATAGLIGRTVVFCMPGSLKACKLACQELIFPEVGHLVKHALTG